MSWFPVLLVAHIALAVSLLLPSVLLPFLLRRGARPDEQPLLRLLVAMQGTGSIVIAIGLAITGIGLLAVLGVELLSRPLLLLALAIYAAMLLVAAFVSRPNLRRLVGIDAGDEATWQRRARAQRWVAYGMAAAVGVIGLLMMNQRAL
ncbi:MAG TPA: hypothetical protein VFM19_06575 [Candidatus Limnocylindria bacterium]|nr:hypothetical protein [Candidatus Limnocylindria bacterium]